MSTRFASPAETGGPAADRAAPGLRRVLVWDAPQRVVHWLVAASFAGAWLTAESEHLRRLHATLGWTLAGLVLFRLLWGFIGTRHARFGDFVRGPGAVLRYLRALLRGTPEHHVGHNPAGAWAIVAMLGLALAAVATGWALYEGVGGDVLEEAHEALTGALLAVVAVHVAGVLLASLMHGENLVSAMFTGRKLGRPEDAVASAWRSVAALVLAAAAGFWAWQWSHPPLPADVGAPAHARAAADPHHDDEDD
jgi:cytochrome b